VIIIINVISIIDKFNCLYITAPRLSEKDHTETLNKALYYSKKAYEEAIAAKESSLRIENVVNEFIKSQSHNDSKECFNGELKGSAKKKHFWYTVSVIFLG